MKRTISLGLVLAALATTPLALAGHHKNSNQHEEKIEKRVDHMEKKLNLTAEQKAKIEDLLKKQMEQIKALREQTRQSIAGILTAEQKAQWEKMKDKK